MVSQLSEVQKARKPWQLGLCFIARDLEIVIACAVSQTLSSVQNVLFATAFVFNHRTISPIITITINITLIKKTEQVYVTLDLECYWVPTLMI